MKKITILVPVFNEQDTIEIFINTTRNIIKNIKNKNNDIDFNYLFVNDGSNDNTYNILKEKSAEKEINFISFSKNFGKESAMLAGLKTCYNELKSDAVIVMDVDLQDDPHLIGQMIDYWKDGYNHVITRHSNRKNEGLLKRVSAKCFYKVFSILSGIKNISQGARDFCLMDQKVVKAYIDFPDQERFTKGISSFVGYRKKLIEFDYIPRTEGKTKWNYIKLFKYAFTGINSFSSWYKKFPMILLFIGLIFLTRDLIVINSQYWFDSSLIRIDLVTIAFSFISILIIDLSYKTLNQAKNRPLYYIEDSNLKE